VIGEAGSSEKMTIIIEKSASSEIILYAFNERMKILEEEGFTKIAVAPGTSFWAVNPRSQGDLDNWDRKVPTNWKATNRNRFFAVTPKV